MISAMAGGATFLLLCGGDYRHPRQRITVDIAHDVVIVASAQGQIAVLSHHWNYSCWHGADAAFAFLMFSAPAWFYRLADDAPARRRRRERPQTLTRTMQSSDNRSVETIR